MGLMTNWMKGTIANGGSSQIDSNKVLHGASEGLNPLSSVDWNVSTPVVLRKPVTATVAQADKAEHEADLLKVAVANGKRVLQAEASKQIATADLAASHRKYLGKTAQANLHIAQANVDLAKKLQGQRKAYASLGMGLDRTVSKVNQTIDVLAAKYGQA